MRYVYKAYYFKIFRVVANDNPISTVELMYTNDGPEDAVGLHLDFTDLPTYIRSVAIRREVREGGRERYRKEGERGREGKRGGRKERVRAER